MERVQGAVRADPRAWLLRVAAVLLFVAGIVLAIALPSERLGSYVPLTFDLSDALAEPNYDRRVPLRIAIAGGTSVLAAVLAAFSFPRRSAQQRG